MKVPACNNECFTRVWVTCAGTWAWWKRPLHISLILMLWCLWSVSMICGRMSMSIGGFSGSSLHDAAAFSFPLCLGLSECRDLARRPAYFSPVPSVKDSPLARRRLHSNKARTPPSRNPNGRLEPAAEQQLLAQDENSLSLRLATALCARDAGVEHVGGAAITSRFFRSHALRYWMLQPQWNGFPDRFTTCSFRNRSKNPGGTVTRRLFCR